MKPVICTVVVQAIKPLKSEISVLYSVHAETFKFVNYYIFLYCTVVVIVQAILLFYVIVKYMLKY